MRVLIACEFSGVVRNAFLRQGADAWSCDLLDSMDGSDRHLKCDVLDVIEDDWDLMIAHPPCTYLARSGARWWAERKKEQEDSIRFVQVLSDCCIPHIAIENPIGRLSVVWRKPDQIIQPWMFGHGETKATCLWLKNLPTLVPTDIVDGREPKVHKIPPSPDRWKKRSITYQGIADAMADQWYDFIRGTREAQEEDQARHHQEGSSYTKV